MSHADQAIVKAMPGNDVCADCPTKNPDWASVSFGNLICLECSGIHRSLGVHISFVRSVAMDSWSPNQLSIMKAGGNKKLNDYLASKGIPPNTPVKAKYESEVAQLYKLRLKARVEGRPEPTSLPPPRNKRAAAPASAPANMGGFGGGGGPKGSTDPNGLERMTGESEQQYVARQTKLREEARVRMQAKFGNGGKMGGVGSSMQGIGSNSNYNPHTGSYGGGYGAPDMGNVMSSVTGAFSTGLSLVSSTVNDPSARASVSNLASTATSYGGSLASTAVSTGGSFWNSLKTTVGDAATAVTSDESDGLAALQRDVQSHMPSQSKYSGFGSTNTAAKKPSTSSMFDSFGSMASTMGNSMGNSMGGMYQQQTMRTPTPPTSGGVSVQEAPGLPGEDRNGMERLTGETDEQYVVRQTRLRDEAKARMAAKFGGGGLSSAGSSSYSAPRPAPSSGNSFSSPASGGAALQEAPGLPGEDRNGMERLTGETEQQYVLRQTRLRDEAKARMAAKFGGGGLSSAGPSSYTPPSSGNGFSAPAPAPSFPSGMSLGAKTTPVKAPSSFGNPASSFKKATPTKKPSSDDFFANFGA